LKDFIFAIIKLVAVIALIIGVLVGWVYLTEEIEIDDKKKCDEAGGTWVEGINYTKNYCIYNGGDKE
jgi:L-asparagine transporter-like permease